MFDCHVTAICSTRNAEFVQKFGADAVVDYSTQNVVETLLAQRAATREYDLLIDCVGGTELFASYVRLPPFVDSSTSSFCHLTRVQQKQLLRPNGAYVTIVGDKTDVKTLGGPVTYFTSPAQIIRYISGYFFGPRYACVALYQKSEYLEQLVALRERGQLQVPIQEIIPSAFDERPGHGWRRAVELMEGARVRGKVVLSIP